MDFHVAHFATARADQLNDFTSRGLGGINRQGFDRFMLLAVDFLDDHVGLRNGHFVAFATHGFPEYRQMKHTASADLEGFAAAFHNAHGGIAFCFFQEAFAEVTTAAE